MKAKLASIAALFALSACASVGAPGASADFDPSRCYERQFSIYFEQQEAELNAAAREAIRTVQDELRGCQIDSVRVLGLAGAAGTSADNLDLSARRALFIEQYMEREASWRGKIETLAAGEAGAVAPDGTPEPMRRVARVTVQASAPAN
ncbi:MAG: OmpA family protein [Hyphomonadaceae bacterium]|jgi:outer membrane protein OmpA-like peptidoglycan-associated protein|nr:OmpA family protein [Hyphomonadaceae bacterium]